LLASLARTALEPDVVVVARETEKRVSLDSSSDHRRAILYHLLASLARTALEPDVVVVARETEKRVSLDSSSDHRRAIRAKW
jgi:uncharacterized protein (DUF169 family)